MKQLLVLIGLVFLVSCERNEFTVPAPAFPSGGSGNYSAPRRSTPMAPPATNHHPMIDNPDAQSEDDYGEVRAYDQSDAEQRCQNLARYRTGSGTGAIVRVQKVVQETKKPGKDGKYKFTCQLRIEYQ